nr:PD-(D/E)XK nuclease family protein [Algoriphagus locisalis]
MKLESVFSRLFSYRQRENITPLENYLTELFAFCLESDVIFRKVFFENCLGIYNVSNDVKVKTQVSYKNFGRPDIEISFADTIILIECKVNSFERKDQLSNYIQILKKFHKETPSKYLVYLTKFFENRDFDDLGVEFRLLRWFSVCDIITNTNSEITIELKKFLIEQGMEKSKNFTIKDLLAMQTIPETMTKMDELLELFKTEFMTEFGGYSKNSSRSSQFYYNSYLNYVALKFLSKVYKLQIGFFWWWEDHELPYVGVSIELPLRSFKNSEFLRLLEEKLVKKHNWEFEENENFYNISSFLPITDFLHEDDNNFEMHKFLQDQLQILYDLRFKDKRLFTK